MNNTQRFHTDMVYLTIINNEILSILDYLWSDTFIIYYVIVHVVNQG